VGPIVAHAGWIGMGPVHPSARVLGSACTESLHLEIVGEADLKPV
jgi:hypothetical protein